MVVQLHKMQKHFLYLFWDDQHRAPRINLTFENVCFLYFNPLKTNFWEAKYYDLTLEILQSLENLDLLKFHEVSVEEEDYSFWSLTEKGQQYLLRNHTNTKYWLQRQINRTSEPLIVAIILLLGVFAPYGIYKWITSFL